MANIPAKGRAIQLCGPGELRLNSEKTIPRPETRQILCKVKTVGLCFSDLKLLKQFSRHVRKSEVESGVDPEILENLPSYVPGDKPTVPGHEVVVEIAEVGPQVSKYAVGDRYVVQADWRWLKTRESNGAFGYNFEGALQDYVLLDERLIESPEGEPMLLPVENEALSTSALALVEPWACVEESYRSYERQGLEENGKLLIVSETCVGPRIDSEFFGKFGKPAETVRVCLGEKMAEEPECSQAQDDIDSLSDNQFDDIIYFGSNSETVEMLFPKAAKNALINIVCCNGRFERNVETPLGDIHYRGIRITGTNADEPSEGYAAIPAVSEMRSGDKIHIVGAGGPMGVMHVMRDITHGVEGIEIRAADLSEDRLAALDRLAGPEARERGVKYTSYSPKQEDAGSNFDYTAIMAPVPALCAEAVQLSAKRGIINIFAGIPAGKCGEIDFNKYVANNLYFVGTSGSVMDDMKIVKEKVESEQLDTNVSVAAISGLDGAIDGLRAVENQEIAGKILVYPDCHGLGLTPLTELKDVLPEVYENLADGVWTKAAEESLPSHANL